MSEPIRIRIRCTEKVRSKWREACAKFDLTYAEMAIAAARFAIENEEEFRRYVYEEERRRPER